MGFRTYLVVLSLTQAVYGHFRPPMLNPFAHKFRMHMHPLLRGPLRAPFLPHLFIRPFPGPQLPFIRSPWFPIGRPGIFPRPFGLIHPFGIKGSPFHSQGIGGRDQWRAKASNHINLEVSRTQPGVDIADSISVQANTKQLNTRRMRQPNDLSSLVGSAKGSSLAQTLTGQVTALSPGATGSKTGSRQNLKEQLIDLSPSMTRSRSREYVTQPVRKMQLDKTRGISSMSDHTTGNSFGYIPLKGGFPTDLQVEGTQTLNQASKIGGNTVTRKSIADRGHRSDLQQADNYGIALNDLYGAPPKKHSSQGYEQTPSSLHTYQGSSYNSKTETTQKQINNDNMSPLNRKQLYHNTETASAQGYDKKQTASSRYTQPTKDVSPKGYQDQTQGISAAIDMQTSYNVKESAPSEQSYQGLSNQGYQVPDPKNGQAITQQTYNEIISPTYEQSSQGLFNQGYQDPNSVDSQTSGVKQVYSGQSSASYEHPSQPNPASSKPSGIQQTNNEKTSFPYNQSNQRLSNVGYQDPNLAGSQTSSINQVYSGQSSSLYEQPSQPNAASYQQSSGRTSTMYDQNRSFSAVDGYQGPSVATNLQEPAQRVNNAVTISASTNPHDYQIAGQTPTNINTAGTASTSGTGYTEQSGGYTNPAGNPNTMSDITQGRQQSSYQDPTQTADSYLQSGYQAALNTNQLSGSQENGARSNEQYGNVGSGYQDVSYGNLEQTAIQNQETYQDYQTAVSRGNGQQTYGDLIQVGGSAGQQQSSYQDTANPNQPTSSQGTASPSLEQIVSIGSGYQEGPLNNNEQNAYQNQGAIKDYQSSVSGGNMQQTYGERFQTIGDVGYTASTAGTERRNTMYDNPTVGASGQNSKRVTGDPSVHNTISPYGLQGSGAPSGATGDLQSHQSYGQQKHSVSGLVVDQGMQARDSFASSGNLMNQQGMTGPYEDLHGASSGQVQDPHHYSSQAQATGPAETNQQAIGNQYTVNSVQGKIATGFTSGSQPDQHNIRQTLSSSKVQAQKSETLPKENTKGKILVTNNSVSKLYMKDINTTPMSGNVMSGKNIRTNLYHVKNKNTKTDSTTNSHASSVGSPSSSKSKAIKANSMLFDSTPPSGSTHTAEGGLSVFEPSQISSKGQVYADAGIPTVITDNTNPGGSTSPVAYTGNVNTNQLHISSSEIPNTPSHAHIQQPNPLQPTDKHDISKTATRKADPKVTHVLIGPQGTTVPSAKQIANIGTHNQEGFLGSNEQRTNRKQGLYQNYQSAVSVSNMQQTYGDLVQTGKEAGSISQSVSAGADTNPYSPQDPLIGTWVDTSEKVPPQQSTGQQKFSSSSLMVDPGMQTSVPSYQNNGASSVAGTRSDLSRSPKRHQDTYQFNDPIILASPTNSVQQISGSSLQTLSKHTNKESSHPSSPAVHESNSTALKSIETSYSHSQLQTVENLPSNGKLKPLSVAQDISADMIGQDASSSTVGQGSSLYTDITQGGSVNVSKRRNSVGSILPSNSDVPSHGPNTQYTSKANATMEQTVSPSTDVQQGGSNVMTNDQNSVAKKRTGSNKYKETSNVKSTNSAEGSVTTETSKGGAASVTYNQSVSSGSQVLATLGPASTKFTNIPQDSYSSTTNLQNVITASNIPPSSNVTVHVSNTKTEKHAQSTSPSQDLASTGQAPSQYTATTQGESSFVGNNQSTLSASISPLLGVTDIKTAHVSDNQNTVDSYNTPLPANTELAGQGSSTAQKKTYDLSTSSTQETISSEKGSLSSLQGTGKGPYTDIIQGTSFSEANNKKGLFSSSDTPHASNTLYTETSAQMTTTRQVSTQSKGTKQDESASIANHASTTSPTTSVETTPLSKNISTTGQSTSQNTTVDSYNKSFSTNGRQSTNPLNTDTYIHSTNVSPKMAIGGQGTSQLPHVTQSISTSAATSSNSLITDHVPAKHSVKASTKHSHSVEISPYNEIPSLTQINTGHASPGNNANTSQTTHQFPLPNASSSNKGYSQQNIGQYSRYNGDTNASIGHHDQLYTHTNTTQMGHDILGAQSTLGSSSIPNTEGVVESLPQSGKSNNYLPNNPLMNPSSTSDSTNPNINYNDTVSRVVVSTEYQTAQSTSMSVPQKVETGQRQTKPMSSDTHIEMIDTINTNYIDSQHTLDPNNVRKKVQTVRDSNPQIQNGRSFKMPATPSKCRLKDCINLSVSSSKLQTYLNNKLSPTAIGKTPQETSTSIGQVTGEGSTLTSPSHTLPSASSHPTNKGMTGSSHGPDTITDLLMSLSKTVFDMQSYIQSKRLVSSVVKESQTHQIDKEIVLIEKYMRAILDKAYSLETANNARTKHSPSPASGYSSITGQGKVKHQPSSDLLTSMEALFASIPALRHTDLETLQYFRHLLEGQARKFGVVEGNSALSADAPISNTIQHVPSASGISPPGLSSSHNIPKTGQQVSKTGNLNDIMTYINQGGTVNADMMRVLDATNFNQLDPSQRAMVIEALHSTIPQDFSSPTPSTSASTSVATGPTDQYTSTNAVDQNTGLPLDTGYADQQSQLASTARVNTIEIDSRNNIDKGVSQVSRSSNGQGATADTSAAGTGTTVDQTASTSMAAQDTAITIDQTSMTGASGQVDITNNAEGYGHTTDPSQSGTGQSIHLPLLPGTANTLEQKSTAVLPMVSVGTQTAMHQKVIPGAEFHNPGLLVMDPEMAEHNRITAGSGIQRATMKNKITPRSWIPNQNLAAQVPSGLDIVNVGLADGVAVTGANPAGPIDIAVGVFSDHIPLASPLPDAPQAATYQTSSFVS